MSALAISGHSERISPGEIRFEVGRPRGLYSRLFKKPILEHILPGEFFSRRPEIARARRF